MRRHFVLSDVGLFVAVITYVNTVRQFGLDIHAVRLTVPRHDFIGKYDFTQFCLVYRERCAQYLIIVTVRFHGRSDDVYACIRIFGCNVVFHRSKIRQIFHFERMRKSVVRSLVRFKTQIGKIKQFLPFCVQINAVGQIDFFKIDACRIFTIFIGTPIQKFVAVKRRHRHFIPATPHNVVFSVVQNESYRKIGRLKKIFDVIGVTRNQDNT